MYISLVFIFKIVIITLCFVKANNKFSKGKQEVLMEIGRKVKHYRILNGLTQEELASRCELSKGFLSQIENDLTSPSISTLADIVEVLGIDLGIFFTNHTTEQFVFTEEDYFIDEQDERLITWLVPSAQKYQMEPIKLKLDPGICSNEIAPFEGECFGYILKGTVSLKYADDKKELKTGETFYLDGKFKHQLINESNEAVELLWVCTPPTF